MTVHAIASLKKRLAAEEGQARNSIEKLHAKEIDFAYEVIATIRAALDLHRQAFRTKSVCDAAATFLCAKVVRTCRAALILTVAGFPAEAEVLVRSALEALINLSFITRERCEERATLFAEFDYAVVRQWFAKLDQYPDMVEALTGAVDVKARRRSLEENFARVKGNYPRITFWAGRLVKNLAVMAKEVQLKWYYDFVYWFGSNQTHGNARSSQEYMEISDRGVPTYKWGPTERGARPTLNLISDLMIRAFECLLRSFSIADQDVITALKDKHHEIFARTAQSTTPSP
jgi:hypothetical protein